MDADDVDQDDPDRARFEYLMALKAEHRDALNPDLERELNELTARRAAEGAAFEALTGQKPPTRMFGVVSEDPDTPDAREKRLNDAPVIHIDAREVPPKEFPPAG